MNNFDQSSTGTNIVLNVCYDNMLSRMFFNDTFVLLQDNVVFYTDHGQCTCPESINDIADTSDMDDDVKYRLLSSRSCCLGALKLKPEYGSVIVNGYGERCTILFEKKSVENLDAFVKEAQHLIYDSPLVINLTVNDKEFDIVEHIKDSYTYDIDEVKSIVDQLPINDYAKKWINEHLPENPQYED